MGIVSPSEGNPTVGHGQESRVGDGNAVSIANSGDWLQNRSCRSDRFCNKVNSWTELGSCILKRSRNKGNLFSGSGSSGSVIATHFQLSRQARNLPAEKLGSIQCWFLGVRSKLRFKSVAVVATSLRSDSSICSFNASGPRADESHVLAPVSVAFCGLPTASSLIDKSALRFPFVNGLNITLMKGRRDQSFRPEHDRSSP
jgi:hypothetical protein